jgi:hypothetical protein
MRWVLGPDGIHQRHGRLADLVGLVSKPDMASQRIRYGLEVKPALFPSGMAPPSAVEFGTGEVFAGDFGAKVFIDRLSREHQRGKEEQRVFMVKSPPEGTAIPHQVRNVVEVNGVPYAGGDWGRGCANGYFVRFPPFCA